MTIDNLSSFKKMLDDKHNEDLKFKAQEVAASYITEAAQRGISMSIDDAYSLPAVRIHILAGQPSGDWLVEAEKTLPSFKKYAEERRMIEELNDDTSSRKAVAGAALVSELDKMSPTERMAFARAHGDTLPGPKGQKKTPLTHEEKASELAALERMPASMKMARYREVFG